MKRRLILTALLLAAYIVLLAPAHAGKVLDDILNYPIVDQRCPADSTDEAMSLAIKGQCQWVVLSKEQSVGQSFRVGPSMYKLWRVGTGICHWPDSWQEGETVTFTLYDSPKKTKKLYSRSLDYAHKWFKWDVVFNTRFSAKPNQEFYFELTHNGGGDNKINVAMIAGDAYKRGQAYVSGAPKDSDLYFTTLAKPKGDRRANLQRLISRFNLDYPSLAAAKKAYAKGDLDGACKAILREFETRTKPEPFVPVAVPKDKLNTTLADQVCDEGRLYRHPDKPEEWIEMSDQTTWKEVWPNSWDTVRQNDLISDLGRAYQTTGNEKYARKMNELMAGWVQDNTSPLEGGSGGANWHSMHQAWRLGDAWTGIGAACKSKGLSDDVKLAWIEYWGRMADYAEKNPSGGNHANAVGEGLMGFGARFPEYKNAEEWKQFGFDKLVSNSLTLFREDGGCKEPTMNYHGFSLVNLMSGLEQARKYGYTVPEEINKVVEKALVYTSYMLQPSGQIPSVGDTDTENFLANGDIWDGWRKGEATQAYTMFGRKDCQWIATAGKEGERPKANSYMFPDTGHYILRSDFGGEGGKDFEQARYLFLRAGHFGSHGHWDLNGFEMYAYGRCLIIDPGRTEYDSPLMPILSANTSHNVLLVDDQKMNRKGPVLNSWHTTPVMDLVDTTYAGLYTNVDHRRAVVFVRPGYYVMFDQATGKEPHKMGLNFWLTPPEVAIDKVSASVHTNEPAGANVLVQVVAPNVEIAERKGSLDLGEVRNDIPVLTFWQSNVSNALFTTLLYPYPKGADCAGVKAAAAGQYGYCEISAPTGTDVVFYSGAAGSNVAGDKGSLVGRSGVIKLDKSGAVSCFGWIDGTSIAASAAKLASASEAVEELSVEYTSDAVLVTCPKAEVTLEIASLGRTKAVVNGKEIAVSGKMFRVFP